MAAGRADADHLRKLQRLGGVRFGSGESFIRYPLLHVAIQEPHGTAVAAADFDVAWEFSRARQPHDAFRVHLDDFSDFAFGQ